MTAEVRSVNCPTCGAGQSVLGGGRVKALVCSYCGTSMAADEDFRALSAARDVSWPETPFSIGMEGEIHGVPVTVIGILGMAEHWQGQSWHWVDHQIYSPTHGYAWLTLEDGHLIFSRKRRHAPHPAVVRPTDIERAEKCPKARTEGETFRYFANETHQIEFAAGSFNFVPQVGQSTEAIAFLSRDRMLTYLTTAGEIEWELSEKLDRDETLAKFGVDPAAAPRAGRSHPLEPFRRSAFGREVRDLALTFFGICLVFLVIAFTIEGKLVADSGWQPRQNPIELDFSVMDERLLIEALLEADVSNAWASFDTEVVDQEDESVVDVERAIELYHGVEGGESWSEGSRRQRVRFRVPEPGAYRLILTPTESGVWRNGTEARTVRVSVREGAFSLVPLIAAAAGFGLIAGGMLLQRFRHNSRRWRLSDWSDD